MKDLKRSLASTSPGEDGYEKLKAAIDTLDKTIASERYVVFAPSTEMSCILATSSHGTRLTRGFLLEPQNEMSLPHRFATMAGRRGEWCRSRSLTH